MLSKIGNIGFIFVHPFLRRSIILNAMFTRTRQHTFACREYISAARRVNVYFGASAPQPSSPAPYRSNKDKCHNITLLYAFTFSDNAMDSPAYVRYSYAIRLRFFSHSLFPSVSCVFRCSPLNIQTQPPTRRSKSS